MTSCSLAKWTFTLQQGLWALDESYFSCRLPLINHTSDHLTKQSLSQALCMGVIFKKLKENVY